MTRLFFPFFHISIGLYFLRFWWPMCVYVCSYAWPMRVYVSCKAHENTWIKKATILTFRFSWENMLVYNPFVYSAAPQFLIHVFVTLLQNIARKGGQESLMEQINSKYYFYTRHKGLFRICYPKERPPTGKRLHTNFQSFLARWRRRQRIHCSLTEIFSSRV